MHRHRSERDLQELEDEDVICGDNPRSPLVLAVFITLCGAIVTTSPPGWLMMTAVGLLLMAACLRSAAFESNRRSRQGFAYDREDASLPLNLPPAPDMLALLRSGRVVVLPHGVNAQHAPSLEDIEGGLVAGAAAGTGPERAVLAQLAQHLAGMRDRVQGRVGTASVAMPITDADLASLPTCTYAPRTPTAASAENTNRSQGTNAYQNVQTLRGRDVSSNEHHTRHTGSSTAGGQCNTDGNVSSAGVNVMPRTDSELTCSICLEEVELGDKLMTLPCLHQYHVMCVKPWLQHQGRHAACPLCKTPVFT